jgi:hypothetical protein
MVLFAENPKNTTKKKKTLHRKIYTQQNAETNYIQRKYLQWIHLIRGFYWEYIKNSKNLIAKKYPIKNEC